MNVSRNIKGKTKKRKMRFEEFAKVVVDKIYECLP